MNLLTLAAVRAEAALLAAPKDTPWKDGMVVGIIASVFGLIVMCVGAAIALRWRKADSAEVTNTAVVLIFALVVFGIGGAIGAWGAWASGLLGDVFGV